MSADDPLDWDFGEQATGSTDAQLAQATEQSDVRWLIADPRGRRIVRGLLERAGVFRSSFTNDALATAFREGERNAGLGLIALVMRHTPERLADVLIDKG
jgi:hypothetical protein